MEQPLRHKLGQGEAKVGGVFRHSLGGFGGLAFLGAKFQTHGMGVFGSCSAMLWMWARGGAKAPGAPTDFAAQCQ